MVGPARLKILTPRRGKNLVPWLTRGARLPLPALPHRYLGGRTLTQRNPRSQWPWSGAGSFSLVAPKMRGHHFRDAESTLGGQTLSQPLLRHFHGHVAGWIVAGSEPTFVG